MARRLSLSCARPAPAWRAAGPRGAQARALLDHVTLLDVGWDVCERAGLLEPGGMRSLDAVHLASALAFVEELEGIVTYDARLRDAALAIGLQVVAPA